MATSPKAASGGKTGKAPVPFPISAQSPFPDKYDIVSERAALHDLVESDDFDQVSLDPRYPRYLELERREEMLRSLKNQHAKRDGANAEVEVAEASNLKYSLGALTDEEEDEMQLHTRDASRLFMGRAVEPGKPGYGQSGAKKVGAALRTVWYLSGNNNPYADFALIEASTRITAQVQELENLIGSMEGKIAMRKMRGMSISVLKADPPVRVALGFRSPYGYSLAHLVSTFDYYARVVKTMVRKDMMSDEEGYAELYTQSRRIRSIFERVIWFQRYLMREELREMTRGDWLPTADDQAKKRGQAAVAIFGELPREVFNGQVTPRHSRRQLDVSAEELRLLDAVPLAGHDPELEAATAALME